MTNISKAKADWTMEEHGLLTMKHTNEEPGPEQLQMTALCVAALTYQAILLKGCYQSIHAPDICSGSYCKHAVCCSFSSLTVLTLNWCDQIHDVL